MEINNHCRQHSFCGLTRALGKNLRSSESVQSLNRIYPKSNGIIGNLPQEWVAHMPIQNRGENIQSLYFDLGNFVKRLPEILDRQLGDYLLTRILRTHKAIGESAGVKITEIDGGCFGQGYRIDDSSNKTPLFIKRFWRKEKGHSLHGSSAETSTKIFLKHDLKKNSEKKLFTKFHYGDINNGYYLEDFIDAKPAQDASFDERREALRRIRIVLKNHGIYHDDLYGDNVIFYRDNQDKLQGICFDLGGATHYPQKNMKKQP